MIRIIYCARHTGREPKQDCGSTFCVSRPGCSISKSPPLTPLLSNISEFITGPVDFLKMDVEGAEGRVLSDLVSSGAIRFIRQMVIEYHHRAGGQGSRLAAFLDKLERAGFDYQFHASLWPVASKNVYQDMMIGAYRNEPDGALTEAKGL